MGHEMYPSGLGSPSCHVAMVGTFPPRLCGLATFGAALSGALERLGHRVDRYRLRDSRDDIALDPAMTGEIVNGDHRSIRSAAERLSDAGAVIVQHEFGIFGGDDGREVVALVEGISAPLVTVLHTVPGTPSAGQREILCAVAGSSDCVVVMSRTAAERAAHLYGIDPDRIAMIPHGAVPWTAVDVPGDDAARSVADGPLELLTWGLLGPGKGIETVIDALAVVRGPRVRYTVAGVTHPAVLARLGESYRQGLARRAFERGVGTSVVFDQTYRDVDALTRFVASSGVVVLPYESTDQVTSGVLVDALAAGRPVIATPFPHAVELLSDGAGIIVPHGDVAAMAKAIRELADDRDRVEEMAAVARRLARRLDWSAVAQQYAHRIAQIVGTRDLVAG